MNVRGITVSSLFIYEELVKLKTETAQQTADVNEWLHLIQWSHESTFNLRIVESEEAAWCTAEKQHCSGVASSCHSTHKKQKQHHDIAGIGKKLLKLTRHWFVKSHVIVLFHQRDWGHAILLTAQDNVIWRDWQMTSSRFQMGIMWNGGEIGKHKCQVSVIQKCGVSTLAAPADPLTSSWRQHPSRRHTAGFFVSMTKSSQWIDCLEPSLLPSTASVSSGCIWAVVGGSLNWWITHNHQNHSQQKKKRIGARHLAFHPKQNFWNPTAFTSGTVGPTRSSLCFHGSSAAFHWSGTHVKLRKGLDPPSTTVQHVEIQRKKLNFLFSQDAPSVFVGGVVHAANLGWWHSVLEKDFFKFEEKNWTLFPDRMLHLAGRVVHSANGWLCQES